MDTPPVIKDSNPATPGEGEPINKVSEENSKSIALTIEEEKKETADLKASFKASLKHSMSKAGSMMSRHDERNS